MTFWAKPNWELGLIVTLTSRLSMTVWKETAKERAGGTRTLWREEDLLGTGREPQGGPLMQRARRVLRLRFALEPDGGHPFVPAAPSLAEPCGVSAIGTSTP